MLPVWRPRALLGPLPTPLLIVGEPAGPAPSSPSITYETVALSSANMVTQTLTMTGLAAGQTVLVFQARSAASGIVLSAPTVQPRQGGSDFGSPVTFTTVTEFNTATANLRQIIGTCTMPAGADGAVVTVTNGGGSTFALSIDAFLLGAGDVVSAGSTDLASGNTAAVCGASGQGAIIAAGIHTGTTDAPAFSAGAARAAVGLGGSTVTRTLVASSIPSAALTFTPATAATQRCAAWVYVNV